MTDHLVHWVYFTWQDQNGDDGAGQDNGIAADDAMVGREVDDEGPHAISDESDEEPDPKKGCDLFDSLEGGDCRSEDPIEDAKDTEDAVHDTDVIEDFMDAGIESATQDAIQDGMEDVELDAERALDMERAKDKKLDLYPSDKEGGGGRATMPSSHKRTSVTRTKRT